MGKKGNEILYEKPYDETSDDTITIPVIEIFRQLKKYVLLWIVIAVVFAGLIVGVEAIFSGSTVKPVTAVVGFYFDGIENGLDPNGNEFDAASIKAPAVVSAALEDMDMEVGLVETFRNCITISGIVPDDAVDEMTAYKSIFEDTGSIDSAKSLMSVSYYPTTFKVQLDYSSTELTTDEAKDFLDYLLDEYKLYFIDTYGTYSLFGTDLASTDYASYDYPQAIDAISANVTSLQSYIDTRVSADKSGFRSSATGYTFSDLSRMVTNLKSIDLSIANSYIIQNMVTRDKETLTDYYNYRIESIERSLAMAQDNLDTILESIENYQKDTVIMMAGTEGSDAVTYTQTSSAYDDLITKKISAQSDVSTYESQLSEYQTRLERLKKSGTAATADKEEHAEELIDAIIDKLQTIIDATNDTAQEYYETVALSGAYSVLVPASGASSTSSLVADAERPVFVVEILLFVLYLCFAVIRAFIVTYRRSVLVERNEDRVARQQQSAPDDETEKGKSEAKKSGAKA